MNLPDALDEVCAVFPHTNSDRNAARDILRAVIRTDDLTAINRWDEKHLKLAIQSTVALFNHNMKPKDRRIRRVK